MTTLTVATVLALATSCQSTVPPNDIRKIAEVESRLNPYAIHDNTGNTSFFPDTKHAAVELANLLIATHHDLDLGLGGINVRNLPKLGLTVETAFDECTNIAASAQVLTWFSRYNTGSPKRGIANGYALKVQFADSASPAKPASEPASDTAPGQLPRPARVGRDLLGK